MTAGPPLVALETIDDRLVATLTGEIDMATVGAVDRTLTPALAGGPAEVVIDLTKVGFLDSSGLRLLFRLAADLRERRARLIVVAPPQTLARRVLDLVAFPDVTEVVDSLA